MLVIIYIFHPVLATLFALVASSITPTTDSAPHIKIEKRATVSDLATLGYASPSRGTTGGFGGTVTTVSTLAQFTAAVEKDDIIPSIIVVSETISEETNTRKLVHLAVDHPLL